MGLAAELQPLWSLASFLTYGPQISENWPRTIRATVPQLLWDVQIQTLFGDICRIINHHCGNSLFIMYEVRGYRVQWLRSKIHIIWRNLDRRLYGFNGIMVKTLNQAAIGKTNENSCKPSSQTSLFLSNFRLLENKLQAIQIRVIFQLFSRGRKLASKHTRLVTGSINNRITREHE